MSVLAAVMTRPGAPLERWKFDEPSLETGDLALEVLASEVCGTDVHLHRGQLAGVPYPIIPGHVSVGRVLETSGVEHDHTGTRLEPGDIVTFYDVHGTCGECWFCTRAGQPNLCESRRVYGITFSAEEGLRGGWAERLHLLAGTHVFRLPEGLEVDDVIGGGCGLFTGYGAVERAGRALGPGAATIVQGCGPVGLGAAAFARLAGADPLIVIGDPEPRLALARRLGADESWSLGGTTPAQRRDRIADATGGRGADVILEASGNPAAVREGFDLLRRGGTYVIAGHYTDAGPVEINPHLDVNHKHADVRGRWGTELSHVSGALSALATHRERLPFADMIGGRYGLEEADAALADVAALRVTKAIIQPNG